MRRVVIALLTVALTACAAGSDVGQEPKVASGDLTFTVGDIGVRVSKGALGVAEDVGVPIEERVRETLEKVMPVLDSPSAVINIVEDADAAIPGVGVGGYTHFDGSIDLSLDPEFEDPVRALNVSLPVLIAHEMHHSKRIQDGPGYGGSLGEAVVSEGSADAFAAEVFPDNDTQPWIDALTDKQRSIFSERLKKGLTQRDHSVRHGEWFFGRGNIPQWAGYTLGYEIATGYMKAHDATAAQLAEMKAGTILKWWRLLETKHSDLYREEWDDISRVS